jgi:hypothetical protein
LAKCSSLDNKSSSVTISVCDRPCTVIVAVVDAAVGSVGLSDVALPVAMAVVVMLDDDDYGDVMLLAVTSHAYVSVARYVYCLPPIKPMH